MGITMNRRKILSRLLSFGASLTFFSGRSRASAANPAPDAVVPFVTPQEREVVGYRQEILRNVCCSASSTEPQFVSVPVYRGDPVVLCGRPVEIDGKPATYGTDMIWETNQEETTSCSLEPAAFVWTRSGFKARQAARVFSEGVYADH
jgi:hypothetical protein